VSNGDVAGPVDARPILRMPVSFGPAPGPRQRPDGGVWAPGTSGARKQTVLRLSRGLRRALIPEQFELGEHARVFLSASYLEEVGWLAGRGHNVLSVDVPVSYREVMGMATIVVWENLADPIITGREELGIAKLYAEIPPVIDTQSSAVSTAAWLGFEFIRLQVSGLQLQSGSPKTTMSPPMLHYKYISKTGSWGESDIEYVTTSPPRPIEVLQMRRGTGSLSFSDSRWEDLPTMSHIDSELRSLPVLSVGGGSLSVLRFAFDGRDQHIL
jgi:hypothetical protein